MELFQGMEKKIRHGSYSAPGGYQQFLHDQQNLVESYNMVPDKGLMVVCPTTSGFALQVHFWALRGDFLTASTLYRRPLGEMHAVSQTTFLHLPLLPFLFPLGCQGPTGLPAGERDNGAVRSENRSEPHRETEGD